MKIVAKRFFFAEKKVNLSSKSRLEKYDGSQKSICKLNEGISFNGGEEKRISHKLPDI